MPLRDVNAVCGAVLVVEAGRNFAVAATKVHRADIGTGCMANNLQCCGP